MSFLDGKSLVPLFDSNGHRLYLTPDERSRFANAALNFSDSNESRTFCRTLYYTGCRPSEALALTSDRVDFTNGALIFHSLKKRSDEPKYRAIPVPVSFLDELNLVHNIKSSKKTFRLWSWSRSTAWSKVKAVMIQANIHGVHATCKGLRHGFGVAHALKKTPLPQIQKWLGHEDLETTAIYMQALGEEERALASSIWD